MYYTDGYPDELPKLSLEPLEGGIDEKEMDDLFWSAQAVVSMLACLIGSMHCTDMRLQAQENTGMAMTFTIVSHLREQLSTLIRTRSERRKKEAVELERKALEAGLRLRLLSLTHPIYYYRKRKLALGARQ